MDDAAFEAEMLMQAATQAAEAEALKGKAAAVDTEAEKQSAKESLQHSMAMEKFGDKKVKYDINKDEYALAPVQWSAHRPRPDLMPGVWGPEEAEELVRYIDWHRHHPQCVTPRPILDPEDLKLGDKRIDEGNAKLYYTPNGHKPPPVLPEFEPTRLGVDCDLDEVSTIAMRNEYEQMLEGRYDNDDPWYTMSVKDNLEQHHIDGDHTTVKSKRSKPSVMSAFDKEAAWQQYHYGSFEGGGPTVSREHLNKLSNLALRDKSLVHSDIYKDKKSPWDRSREFTKYTKDGTALDEYNHVKLMRNVDRALNEYKREVHAESVRLGFASRKSKKREEKRKKQQNADDVVGFDSEEEEASGRKGLKLFASAKVAPAEDQFQVMRDKVGDDRTIDRMTMDLVRLAKYVAKKAKIQKSAVDATMDLVEACKKLRIMKVRALLLSNEVDADMLTPEDEPIFVHMFSEAIRLDLMSGHLRLRHAHQDSGDRKKIGRILTILADAGAEINTLKGRHGHAPVHMACIADNSKLVAWLFRRRANMELLSQHGHDDEGCTSGLMLAAKYGHVELISEMIRKGVTVDAVNEEGHSALHFAAIYGQTRAALFLMKLGAKKLRLDKHGRTPGHLATEKKYMATAQAIAGYAVPKEDVASQLNFIVDHEVTSSVRSSWKGNDNSMRGLLNRMTMVNLSQGAAQTAQFLGRTTQAVIKALRKTLFPNTVYMEEEEADDGGYDSDEEEEKQQEAIMEEAKKKENRKQIQYIDPFASASSKKRKQQQFIAMGYAPEEHEINKGKRKNKHSRSPPASRDNRRLLLGNGDDVSSSIESDSNHASRRMVPVVDVIDFHADFPAQQDARR